MGFAGLFLRGSFAVLSLAWSAVGGIVGVAVMFVMEGWLPLPTGIAIGASIALFVAYHNSQTKVAELDRGLSDLKASHARDVEWVLAIETFQGIWNEAIDAVLTRTTEGGVTTEVWSLHLYGSTGDHDAKVRACETACKVAGHALSLSKVWRTLPPEVASHRDPLEQWLRFVAFKDGFHGMKGDGYDNTGPQRIKHEVQSIAAIHQRSKRLCEDCRNSESFL